MTSHVNNVKHSDTNCTIHLKTEVWRPLDHEDRKGLPKTNVYWTRPVRII